MEKKNIILELSAKYAGIMEDISDRIWEFAEAGMREYKSAQYLVDTFKKQGFTVKSPVADMPTALIAEAGSGAPIIGFLGEYDALPGIKQDRAVPKKTGGASDEWGHGCGHNNLGAGAAGAAMMLKDYFELRGSGTVRFYGCPGEESGSGKAFMARAGLFDDLDACYTWHPDCCNTVVGESSLACMSALFAFHGCTSHAAGSPQLGRSALDACELMGVGTNYLREHMVSDARIHYSYVDAGNKAPNVIPDFAKVNYFIRHPKVKGMMELLERVKDVARGAALMTGTTFDMEIVEGLSDYIPNRTLDKVTQEAYEQIGAPLYDEQDEALAQQFRATLTSDDIDKVYNDLRRNGVDLKLMPREWNLCKAVLPYKENQHAMGGSTDVGDASYCAPTSQILACTQTIGTPGHSWQMTAQSGSCIAKKATMTAAQVMALSAAMVADMPEVLKQAKVELTDTTGGKYICPIPDDIKPM